MTASTPLWLFGQSALGDETTCQSSPPDLAYVTSVYAASATTVTVPASVQAGDLVVIFAEGAVDPASDPAPDHPDAIGTQGYAKIAAMDGVKSYSYSFSACWAGISDGTDASEVIDVHGGGNQAAGERYIAVYRPTGRTVVGVSGRTWPGEGDGTHDYINRLYATSQIVGPAIIGHLHCRVFGGGPPDIAFKIEDAQASDPDNFGSLLENTEDVPDHLFTMDRSNYTEGSTILAISLIVEPDPCNPDAGATAPLTLLAYAEGNPTDNAGTSSPTIDVPTKVYPDAADPIWTTNAKEITLPSSGIGDVLQIINSHIDTGNPQHCMCYGWDAAGTTQILNYRYAYDGSLTPQSKMKMNVPGSVAFQSGARIRYQHYETPGHDINYARQLVAHGWARKVLATRLAAANCAVGPMLLDTIYDNAGGGWASCLTGNQIVVPSGEDGLYLVLGFLRFALNVVPNMGWGLRKNSSANWLNYRHCNNQYYGIAQMAFVNLVGGDTIDHYIASTGTSTGYDVSGDGSPGSLNPKLQLIRVNRPDVLGIWDMLNYVEPTAGTPFAMTATVYGTRGAGALVTDGHLLNEEAGWRLIIADGYRPTGNGIGPKVEYSDDGSVWTALSGNDGGYDASEWNSTKETKGGGFIHVENAPAGRQYRLVNYIDSFTYTAGFFGLIKLTT